MSIYDLLFLSPRYLIVICLLVIFFYVTVALVAPSDARKSETLVGFEVHSVLAPLIVHLLDVLHLPDRISIVSCCYAQSPAKRHLNSPWEPPIKGFFLLMTNKSAVRRFPAYMNKSHQTTYLSLYKKGAICQST